MYCVLSMHRFISLVSFYQLQDVRYKEFIDQCFFCTNIGEQNEGCTPPLPGGGAGPRTGRGAGPVRGQRQAVRRGHVLLRGGHHVLRALQRGHGLLRPRQCKLCQL